MGDLPRLKELAAVLAEALTDITRHASDEEKAAKSLEGSLLKSGLARVQQSIGRSLS